MARPSAKPPGETPDTAVPDPSQFGEYSSPPCFMHEFASSFVGLPDGGDQSSHTPPPNLPLDWPAVRQWRKETRAGLIERRVHISAQDRADWSGSIGEKLEAAL